MLEEILDYRNIAKALEQVTANKGAGGVDGMSTGELRVWLESNWTSWEQNILKAAINPNRRGRWRYPNHREGSECWASQR
jgi:RNA-directed DNA polymerase